LEPDAGIEVTISLLLLIRSLHISYHQESACSYEFTDESTSLSAYLRVYLPVRESTDIDVFRAAVAGVADKISVIEKFSKLGHLFDPERASVLFGLKMAYELLSVGDVILFLPRTSESETSSLWSGNYTTSGKVKVAGNCSAKSSGHNVMRKRKEG
jgi:hypothetical protein